MELGKNILKRCSEKGITVAGLARLNGVKQPTIFGWTTGRAVHKIEDLKKVCVCLEISLHQLLFGCPDPFEKQDDKIEEFVWGQVKIVMYRIPSKGEV